MNKKTAKQFKAIQKNRLEIAKEICDLLNSYQCEGGYIEMHVKDSEDNLVCGEFENATLDYKTGVLYLDEKEY